MYCVLRSSTHMVDSSGMREVVLSVDLLIIEDRSVWVSSRFTLILPSMVPSCRFLRSCAFVCNFIVGVLVGWHFLTTSTRVGGRIGLSSLLMSTLRTSQVCVSSGSATLITLHVWIKLIVNILFVFIPVVCVVDWTHHLPFLKNKCSHLDIPIFSGVLRAEVHTIVEIGLEHRPRLVATIWLR